MIVSKISKEYENSPSILINAAGVNHDGLLVRSSIEKIHDTIQTNLLGSIHLCKTVCRNMMRERNGSKFIIVFIII